MSRHQVLDETWCPRGPLGHQKYSKTVELSAKLRFSAFHVKWLWGWVLGCFLGRFWTPSWCQVGPCWAPSWFKMALENHSQNWVVKNPRKGKHPTSKRQRTQVSLSSNLFRNLKSQGTLTLIKKTLKPFVHYFCLGLALIHDRVRDFPAFFPQRRLREKIGI